MGGSIGVVAMSAHLLHQVICGQNKIAHVAATHLGNKTASGAVVEPIAPGAVSDGTGVTRTGITLGIVLSGHQPSAPLASPSTLHKNARIHATTMERTNTETSTIAGPMWQSVPTPASVSRRGRGRLGMTITDQPSALETPPAKES